MILKPLYPYGSVQDLSVIEETNAYCWVDIVVNAADAWVRFEGDGASNLADPSFAAKAGETNHVVILIGKTYKVTCDMPFTVVGKSDPAIDEWWEDGNTLWLNWPVNIWSVGDDEEPPLLLMSFGLGSHRGNGFTMFVSPSGLGGEFNWTNSCCAVYGSGLHFSYGCDGFCLCGGCSARGYYGYEGYRIGCNGGSCGCSWYDDDDRHGEDDPDDPEPTPSISVCFSKDAVIFEDAYTNAPGDVVSWRSTTSKLHLEVHGGMKGGTAEFTFTNQEKLLGPDIPESINVPAGHCKRYEFTYRGQLPSGSTNDIVVTGTFTENHFEGEGDAATYNDEASMTSVKLELTAEYDAPENSDSRRHIYGVAERVYYHVFPESSAFSFALPEGFNYWEGGSFVCPWTLSGSGETYNLEMTYSSVRYIVPVRVLKPVIVAYNQRVNDATNVVNVVGEAGHLLLCQDLYATPLYVSFAGVQFREVPDESQSGSHSGYYDDRSKGGNWSHTQNDGAGVWWGTRRSGYFASDKAGRRVAYSPPWINGSKEWAIPMEWGNGGSLAFRFNPDPTTQRFTMQPTGTFKIEKFGHNAERNVLGLFWLDGFPLLW